VTWRSATASCRRHRRRSVAAAADQVEEGGGELVRAGRPSLAEQRRHESGLALRRRLLLVLTVVTGPLLAAVDEPDQEDEPERGTDTEEKQVENRSADVALGVVDALPVALVRVLRRDLLGDDLLKAVPLAHLGAGRRPEKTSREQQTKLDELVRGNQHRAKKRTVAAAGDHASDPRGAPPYPIRGRELTRSR
jgi:hypothetical protein